MERSIEKKVKLAITAVIGLILLYFVATTLMTGHDYSFLPTDMGIEEGESLYFTRIENVWVRRGIYRMEIEYSSEGGVISFRPEGIRVRNTYLGLPTGENMTHSAYVYVDSAKGTVAIGLEGGDTNFRPQRLRLTYLRLMTLGYHLEHTFLPFGFILLAVWLCFSEWVRALSFRGWYFFPAAVFSAVCFPCRMIQYGADVSFPDYIRDYPADTICSILLYYLSFLSLAVLLDALIESYAERHSKPEQIATKRTKTGRLQRLRQLFERHPFRMCLLTLFLAWLPCIIVSYPGIPLRGDTWMQLTEALELRPLTNEHPINHTRLIRLFLSIGAGTGGSYNLGLYLYCLLQVAVLLLIFAYSVRVLIRTVRAPLSLWAALLAYYALHPRIQSFLMSLTKDVLYSAFLVLLITVLFELRLNGWRVPQVLLLIIASVGAINFNHEGKVIVAFCALLLPTVKIYGRILTGAAVLALVLVLCFPAEAILKSGRAGGRVLGTLFYQPTIRYLYYHPEDMDEEEEAVIRMVFFPESAREGYNPIQQDSLYLVVSGYYGTDLSRYLRTWFSLFQKHPDTMIKGFLYNKVACFYPVTMFYNNYIYKGGISYPELGWPDDYFNGEKTYDGLNETAFENEHVLGFPEGLRSVREAYEVFRESITALPVIEHLASTHLYVWGIAMGIFLACRRKRLWKCHCFILFAPMILQLGSRLADTCNGDMLRYSLPFLFALPAVLLYSLCLYATKRQEETS